MRRYEGMFIIKSDIDQKGQETCVDSIKAAIAKNGGKVILSEKWGSRNLAYPIDGHGEGVYYRFEFETEPPSISALKRACRLNEDIIRELIIAK